MSNASEAAKKPKQTPRERLRSMGATVSVILVLFMMAYIPTGPLKKYRISRAELEQVHADLATATMNKQAEIARLHSQEKITARLEERKKNFDLWSFLNTVLTETKLKDRGANLENYKPRSEHKNAVESVTMVQLRLTSVTMGELIDLLHKVYAANNLVVLYRLEYLRPASDGKGLECNAVFLTPKG